jgi:hypothetical protein
VRGIKTCLPVTGRRAVLFEICNLQFEILRAPRPSATKGAAFGIRQACAAWTAPEGNGLLDILAPAPALALTLRALSGERIGVRNRHSLLPRFLLVYPSHYAN